MCERKETAIYNDIVLRFQACKFKVSSIDFFIMLTNGVCVPDRLIKYQNVLLSNLVTKIFSIHLLLFIWKHWNMILRLSRCNNGWESKYFAFYCSSSFFFYACVFWELFSKATNSEMTRPLSKHVTLDILMWSKSSHLKTRHFFNSFYICL